MHLVQSFHDLLTQIGPGLEISRSPYDTAWVARLAELDIAMGQQALDWLRGNQLSDGSWGSVEPKYAHERVICTLAAMTTLAARGASCDQVALQCAKNALEDLSRELSSDPAGETIGFEMIVPSLLDEAKELGLINSSLDKSLGHLAQYRAAKLAALPDRVIDRTVTVAFSAEMVGLDGLHLLDLERLREANGSVAYSPAATSFFAYHVQPGDPAALDYLSTVIDGGSVPYIAPIEIFEIAWTLWNLELAGLLDAETMALCQPHLDAMEVEWQAGRGSSACAGLTLAESDTTSMVYKVMHRLGRPVDLEGILNYEEDKHFRCFSLEANPSLSANIHVLDALRCAGLGPENPAVRKVLDFLQRTQTLQMIWFDKWHASPYYPTTHAVIACCGMVNDLVKDSVYWIIATQRPNGAWGHYGPTAEETAYCLQALVVWKRCGGEVPDTVLMRGATWLAHHMEPPYPSLWIGKCLYCPTLVTRSTILSALLMVESEIGG
jgi:halimadienyl-diphosphate synthase